MASRISRKECTRGRPVPAWVGRYGSRQVNSTSERSVGYALLIMLGSVPSHRLKTTFRTVSPGTWVNKGKKEGRGAATYTVTLQSQAPPPRSLLCDEYGHVVHRDLEHVVERV